MSTAFWARVQRMPKEVMDEGADFPPEGCLCDWVNRDDNRKWIRVTTHLKCPSHNIRARMEEQ